MPKFYENYPHNMIVIQNPENIKNANYHQSIFYFYIKNQNESKEQIKYIINYINKKMQE